MIYDHEGQILEPYSKAPLEVLHHKGITDFSKLVYFELYSIYDQNRERNDHLFIKDETLAKKLFVTERYIKKCMRDLEDNQLIIRETSAFDKSRQSKKREIYIARLKRNENYEISYATFPKSIYEKDDISTLAKIALIELISLLDTQGHEEIAADSIHIGKLAETLGKSRETILNNLNKLEEHNYILMDGTGSYRTIQLEKESIYNNFLPF